MKLIITIDTEEDDWSKYKQTGSSVENISRIPRLQRLFDDFDVKPTYLISYPVANDTKSVAILKEILQDNRCEIGTHCHPWNTPPYKEKIDKDSIMLFKLSAELQYEKITTLHNTIINNFDIVPISFRAGRWAYGRQVAENLKKLGYKIDTSITSFTNWSRYNGANFSNIPPKPYRFSPEKIFEKDSNGELLEVPVTVGYLQRNDELSHRIWRILDQKHMRILRLNGLLRKLNLINKVYLSPEESSAEEMISLTKKMATNGSELINMYFHSNSLKHGLTPFVRTASDEEKFFERIREYLAFSVDYGVQSIKLSDSLDI